MTKEEILDIMKERILILDGGTGTYLMQHHLTEDDFRGITNEAFTSTERGRQLANHPVPLKGCNDVLCLTQPEVIIKMHQAYLEAGANIIETNSFNSNCFSLEDYGLENCVYEIAKAAAECARKAIDTLSPTLAAKDEMRLVAGSMGPTNRTLSMSSDVNNPAQRDITFQQLYDTYKEQARGLWDGGADVLLIETIFDTLNAKVALKAILDLSEEIGEDIPVMASCTLSDASGRTLSGQTVEAFLASMQHGNLLSIGLNCGFGAKQLLPWLRRLSEIAPCPISVHPNAGLPNVMGGYDETPETFAEVAKEVFGPPSPQGGASDSNYGLVNIYGGCCGTTPLHIQEVAKLAKGFKPRPLPTKEDIRPMFLSGLEPLAVAPSSPRGGEGGGLFINVGERTNVAGSAKFKKLIQAKDYEAALSVARQQVENGAQVIDICMDDGLIDGVEAMTTFLNLLSSEPEISRVPVMIDSSKWEILQAGLQCVQGKSIVNSISLKEGEEKFLEKAKYIHSMGAATVVMLFDEKGQADTYERKVEVARRAYKLLRGIGFPGEDIIFDPNVLAVATGMPEHDDYARAFIAACATIHEEMPEVHMSGGISNLSFSFRGNNTIRQAMHSVFLYHAMKAGLDMSIVNPAMTTIYSDIPQDMLKVVEDVILNRPLPCPSSREGDITSDNQQTNSERLIDFAMKVKEEEASATDTSNPRLGAGAKGGVNWRTSTLPDRIQHAMLKGITDYIEEDTLEAYGIEGTALGVIDHYLMPAMEEVGRLFGEGKMFLPQVVKSARVMKKAVAVIEPYMSAATSATELTADNTKEGKGSGLVLMATVKGDVHDIGKNIVGVVIQCNGYNVKDLGVMVDADTIVDTAQKEGAAVIGLSGLITPSLDEMIRVCKELQRRGMTTPVIVGGATTSALHTAVKMAPEYPDGIVVHAHAAADNPSIIRRLLTDDREEYIAELKGQQRIIRDNYNNGGANKKTLLSLEEAKQRRHIKRVGEIAVPTAEAMAPFTMDVKISDIKSLINWNMFYQAWGLKGEKRKDDDAQQLISDAQQMLREMEVQGTVRLSIMARILPAVSNDNDEIVITRDGEDFPLPMPRSLKDEPETNCLADHIMRPLQALRIQACPCCSQPHQTDFICPFVVTAGIGINALQEHYRQQGDEYRAIMAKLLADRMAEALAEYLEKRIGWGTSHIRMAFGYGACPDHKLKEAVFNILHVKDHLPLSLTDSYMINPGESICGLIFANTPTKYFNV